MTNTVTGTPQATYPNYQDIFSEYQEAVADKAEETQQEAQERIVEVKPDGKIAITGEAAFAGSTLANNNPKVKIEADIFLRNVDNLNKQFIFGPYARLDATVASDYKNVLTNISTETDPVFTDISETTEEKKKILTTDKITAAIDLGIRLQHQLLAAAAPATLQLDYWLPLSFWSDIKGTNISTETEDVQYWVGTRPGASLEFTTTLWQMPILLFLEDSCGFGFNGETTRIENELKAKADWTFLSWLELRLRNTFRTTSLVDVETEYHNVFSVGLRLKPMKEFFLDIKPFIYTYEATHPVAGDPYNGLMRMLGELTASFDISKDLTFLAGFDFTYAGVDKDQDNTAQAKPLTVFAGIEMKL